jgi:hypothetical protein
MMLDAETRAVVLAEYQMQTDSWKRPDRDEADLATCCEVCATPIVPCVVNLPSGGTAMRNPRPGTRVCPDCIRKHWRSAGCLVCGSVTKSWNWTSKKRNNGHYGWCQTCRDADNREKELVG